MFREMLESLKNGVLPSSVSLRPRLALALVKKSGILQQPPPCWSNDPKINPEARHLLWAAVIVEDVEAIGLAAGLLTLELQAARPGYAPAEIRAEVYRQLNALADQPPNQELRRALQSRIDRAESHLPGL